jgi:hypothetical protein
MGSARLSALTSDCDPPLSTSWVVGIIDTKHHSWLFFFFWDGVLQTFCWVASNYDPPIFSSQVACITVVCDHTSPSFLFQVVFFKIYYRIQKSKYLVAVQFNDIS